MVARVMPLACASFQSREEPVECRIARRGCCAARTGRHDESERCERAENHPCSLHQRDETAAVPLQAAGDLEFQQHGAHDCRRRLRQPYQIVDVTGAGPSRSTMRARSSVAGSVQAGRAVSGLLDRLLDPLTQNRPDYGKHVGGFRSPSLMM